ncbi:hypothetical protein ACIBF1_10020 [Spirillospora sp. NPDC050679]
MGDGLNISGVGGDISGEILVGDGNSVNKVVVNAENTTVVFGGTAPALRPRTRPAKCPVPDEDGAEPPAIGRDAELAAIDEALAACGRVQVNGEPGTGKSVLLRELAARRAVAGDDVVFLSATGVDAEDLVQELFQTCYDTSGYRPDGATLNRLMGTIEALVVIDGFSGTAADLKTLLAAVPASALVLATREPVPFDGRHLGLQGLDAAPARELLARELRREPTEDEMPAVAQLWRATDGRPAALVRAAAATRAAGTALGTDPAALTGALAAGLNAQARAMLGLLCGLDGVPLPDPLVEPLAGPGAWSGLEQLKDGGLATEDASGFAAAGEAARAVAAEAGLSPDATSCAPALLAWVRAASAQEVCQTSPVILRVLLETVEKGAHAAARDLARASAPALALGLRWGAWSRVLAIGMRAARALGSQEDQKYFEREDRTRLKALGKGATAGVAITASYTIGQHVGASSAPPAAAPGGGGPGHILTRPSVLATTAMVAVLGGAAALGLFNVPQSASSPRAAFPSSAEPSGEPRTPTSRKPPRRTPAPGPSAPDPSAPGPSRSSWKPPSNPAEPGPTQRTPTGDDRKAPCEVFDGVYSFGGIKTVNVYPAAEGYAGRAEIALAWGDNDEGGCFPAGDGTGHRVVVPTGTRDDRAVFRIDGSGCKGEIRGGRVCRLTVDAEPAQYGYYLIEVRISVPGQNRGMRWHIATQPFSNTPTGTPTTD